jgi:hypothetical protein
LLFPPLRDKPRTFRKGDPLFATTKSSAFVQQMLRSNTEAHWSFTYDRSCTTALPSSKQPRADTVVDSQVIRINISNNPGSPLGVVQRATADLPNYVCKNFLRLSEEPRLTGAYWKEEAAWSETGYYATIKNTSD